MKVTILFRGPITPKIVIAVPLVSLLLWVLSIRQAELAVSQGIGEFGLFSVLPTYFFISLSLLTASFLGTLRMRGKSQLMLFLQLMMLILMLYLTPALAEGTPRFSQTYYYYQAVDYISKSAHVDQTVAWMHSWPAFAIAFSTLVQVIALAGAPSEQVLLTLYPLLLNIALFFPLFSLVRVILDQQKFRWMALWVFYIANWVGQDYFSAQSFALFMFILMLFVLFKTMDSHGGSVRWLLVSLLLFSCLTTSHLLTSLAWLAVIVALVAFKHLSPTLILPYAVLAASWTIYGAIVGVPWALIQVISQALKPELIFRTNVVARVAGSNVHIIVTEARIIFSASIAMFALSGVLLLWKRRKFGKTERRIALVFAGVCSVSVLSVYGGELFQRIFLLSLLPLAYFIYRASSWKPLFLVIAIFLVVMAPPLNVIAHYGNEKMDYVPPSELGGIGFFHDKTSQGYVIGWYRDLEYRQSYAYFWLSDVKWESNVFLLPDVKSHADWHTFVCMTNAQVTYYGFQAGQPEVILTTTKNLSGSAHYDKIYSNPGFEVYLEL